MATERHRRRKDVRTIFQILCSAGLLLPPCFAVEPALEYEVKAAFLLNFTKFVEWPPTAFADAESPFAICILGKDPFGSTIDDILQGEAVNGRKLVVRRLSQPPAVQTCQMVFFEAPSRDLPKTLAGLGRGVLTVSEGDRFVVEGGMIGLVVENRRIRFDVNRSAIENSGLKVSSKLLSVARTVVK